MSRFYSRLPTATYYAVRSCRKPAIWKRIVSPNVHFVLGFNKFVMENIGTREYTVLPKGSGFVYAYANRLYRRVKTQGSTKYLKCTTVGCDGSAKLVDGLLFIGVSEFV